VICDDSNVQYACSSEQNTTVLKQNVKVKAQNGFFVYKCFAATFLVTLIIAICCPYHYNSEFSNTKSAITNFLFLKIYIRRSCYNGNPIISFSYRINSDWNIYFLSYVLGIYDWTTTQNTMSYVPQTSTKHVAKAGIRILGSRLKCVRYSNIWEQFPVRRSLSFPDVHTANQTDRKSKWTLMFYKSCHNWRICIFVLKLTELYHRKFFVNLLQNNVKSILFGYSNNCKYYRFHRWSNNAEKWPN